MRRGRTEARPYGCTSSLLPYSPPPCDVFDRGGAGSDACFRISSIRQPVRDESVCASFSRRSAACACIQWPPDRCRRRSTRAAARSGPGSSRGRRSPGTPDLRGSARVVADVQARDEDVLAPAAARRRPAQNTPSCRSSSADSGSAAHGSHHAMSQAYSRNTARIVLAPDLLRRTSPVEPRELVLDVRPAAPCRSAASPCGSSSSRRGPFCVSA